MIKLKDDGYPEVRPVTRKDRKTFSKLIKAFANKSSNKEILELAPKAKAALSKSEEAADEAEEENEDDETISNEMFSLMQSVIENLIEWLDQDVTVWFMDLIGAETEEEIDAMPFDIDIYIIESLIKQKGFKSFFSRALGLYKQIQG